jgi:hypothetical protein
MIRRLLVMCLSFLSCTRPPTPAGLALSAFLEQIAKGNHVSVAGDLASGSRLNDKFKGELVEGTVEVIPRFNIGVHDWSKTKVLKEEVLPTGDHRLEVLLDVCLRSEDQARCTRPNVYAFTAIVTNEDGTWKVSAASCSEKDIIR